MSTILKIFTFFFLAATVTATAQKITPNKLPDDSGMPPSITPIDHEQIISIDTTTSPEVRAMIELMKNKDKYIGEPFSELIKDLPKPIVHYAVAPVIKPNDANTDIAFTFYNELAGNLYKKANIVVVWQTSIEREEFRSLQHIKPGTWNAEIEDFFAPRVISDFGIVEPWIVSKYGGWLKWEQRDKTKTLNELLSEYHEE